MTTYRVGRTVGRTLYRGDDLIGVLDDPDLAARVANLLNADHTRRAAGGHEIVVTHNDYGPTYEAVCHEPASAACRVDLGVCQVLPWLNEDPIGLADLAEAATEPFEVGRFPITPVWIPITPVWRNPDGYEWRRADA